MHRLVFSMYLLPKKHKETKQESMKRLKIPHIQLIAIREKSTSRAEGIKTSLLHNQLF